MFALTLLERVDPRDLAVGIVASLLILAFGVIAWMVRGYVR